MICLFQTAVHMGLAFSSMSTGVVFMSKINTAIEKSEALHLELDQYASFAGNLRLSVLNNIKKEICKLRLKVEE